jgi:hypothetical protein
VDRIKGKLSEFLNIHFKSYQQFILQYLNQTNLLLERSDYLFRRLLDCQYRRLPRRVLAYMSLERVIRGISKKEKDNVEI